MNLTPEERAAVEEESNADLRRGTPSPSKTG